MRRVFPLLLVFAPFVASCSDSTTPVASPGAMLSLEEVEAAPSAEWVSPENDWTLDEWLAAPAEESPLQVAPGTGALMEFGNPQAGTDYPPQTHDQSLHGKDRVIPGTVVIDAGQTVSFRVYPGHRVGIYKPGVQPNDIVVNPGPFVLDPTNRIALQGQPAPMIKWTFHKPGRYLVICAISRHFVEAKMYGWVIVR